MLRLHARPTQMFDVGFAELFLLGLVGLIVLGPERLPAVARTLGGLVRKARASWAGLRSTIEAELAEADIAKPLKEVSDEFRQLGKDLKPNLPDVNSILRPPPESSNDPKIPLKLDDATVVEAETGIATEADTETAAEAETKTAAEAETETAAEAETKTAAPTEAGTAAATETGIATEAETETGAAAETETVADTHTAADSNTKSESTDEPDRNRPVNPNL